MNARPQLGRSEQCVIFIARGLDVLQEGELLAAEAGFRAALSVARSRPQAETVDFVPLALYCLSLLRHRMGKVDESKQFREQAADALRDNPVAVQPLYHRLMSDVLFELGEYRRAIPFFEQTIQLERDSSEPIMMAELLRRAGECYNRSGLKDHAAIPLRAAVNIFRNHPEDPRLPAALVTLGNALRKAAPAEAESYYREAADIHAACGHLESATTAWVNLGSLCSEQGRHAESLDFYERALRVREQSPRTPPERMGTLLNNIANSHRRQGNFSEAFAAVDRAIELLKKRGGSSLAAAYGTRGLIFRDDQCDAEAVEWLRKAYAEQQSAPTPNLATLAEDLEHEIEALRRLQRSDEAADAEQKLAAVRAAMNAVPTGNSNFGTLDTATEALFIEIDLLSHRGNQFSQTVRLDLERQLAAVIENEKLSAYAGGVTIPESTTLIFYCSDAEAMFRSFEPVLSAHALCAGARITIRQSNGACREVVLPGRVI